jgi:hypothetical protein
VTLRRQAAFVLLWTVGAAAPALAERLGSDQLREEIAGNTLTGFNTSGVVFSEYHAPDGRVLGHNNGVAVVDGCWAVKGDAICYYYKAQRAAPAAFCWHYDRAGSAGYRLTSIDTRVTGAARLERGNPHGHSDRGEGWTCEGLVSEADRPLSPIPSSLSRSRR